MLQAQEPLSPALMGEDYLYRDETVEVPVETYERFADLISHPININSASSDQLGETGLFTPYQIHSLIKYREKYGRLYSLYELAALAGFRISRLREIAPCLTVDSGPWIRENKKNKHMIMVNMGKILPEADGYKSKAKDGSGSPYRGSPLRTDLRIKSQIGNHLSLGLTFEKDPGEHFYSANRPEFLSGFVQYSGHRLIKQLVIGNFQLNQGLGLVNGAGFLHSPERFRVNSRSMSKIRPYSSKSESGFERGVAVRMNLRTLEFLCWASYRNMDLSTRRMDEGSGKINWREHLLNSGLHRTSAEIEGRDLAFRIHSGIQGQYRYRNLDTGLAFSSEAMGLSRSGIQSMGISGKTAVYQHLSLHGKWMRKGWQVFGEMAISDWNALALLTGVSWELNDFVQGLLLLHHYGISYTGSLPSAYASGSKINNETGLALHLHLEPGRRLQADFSGELFKYPGPRYLTQVPSSGQRYSLTIRNSGTPKFQWRVRMVNKIWQSTPSNSETGLPPIRTSQLSRFDLRFVSDQLIQWQSRLLASFLSGSTNPYPAYAVVQQVAFQCSPYLKSTVQFVVFDVREWENRIYLYEPGLYYSFAFPSLYGTGQKTTVVLSLKLFQKLSISGKIALTSYRNRQNTGTGNDMLKGNKKCILELQVRLNL